MKALPGMEEDLQSLKDKGETLNLTSKSDIFAVGAIYFFMLFRFDPFQPGKEKTFNFDDGWWRERLGWTDFDKTKLVAKSSTPVNGYDKEKNGAYEAATKKYLPK